MLVKVVVQRGDEPTRRKERPKGRRRQRGWRGRRGDGVPAKPRSSRGGGRRCDVNGGDGDVGRRTGDEQQPAGDGEVVATPLDTGEDASPVLSPRNGGLTEGEEVAARPREKTARPDGARARRERRLEAAGAEKREGRRRGGSSGGLRGKRRASRGGGGGGDAGGGDGAAGRRTVEAAQAAGGGRQRGRERRATGRWIGTTGRLGRGLKRENGG
nr:transposon protein, putative, unclassified [Oryza sativa Japonica Group]